MLTSRDALVAAVLKAAPAKFGDYVGANRHHATHTAVLVATMLFRAKTIRAEASPMFYAAVAEVMAWVKDSPSARDLARSLVRQDRETVDDEMRACVPADLWVERCIAIDVALSE